MAFRYTLPSLNTNDPNDGSIFGGSSTDSIFGTQGSFDSIMSSFRNLREERDRAEKAREISFTAAQAFKIGAASQHKPEKSDEGSSWFDKVKHAGGGVLSTVVDNLSRVNHGVAEGARQAYHGKSFDIGDAASTLSGFGPLKDAVDAAVHGDFNPIDNSITNFDVSDFLGGFKEGVTLRKRTTFGDVLKEHGAFAGHANLRGVAGFGLDVALDPTTYVFGSGVARKVGTTAAARGLEEMALKGIAQGTVENVGTKASKAFANSAEDMLKGIGEGATREEWAKGVAGTVKTSIYGNMQSAADNIAKYHQYRIGFRDASLPLTPQFKLPGLASAEKIPGIGKVASTIGHHFKPEYKAEVVHAGRQAALHASEDIYANEILKRFRGKFRAFKNLSPDDKFTALRAAEKPGMAPNGVLDQTKLAKELASRGVGPDKLTRMVAFVDTWNDATKDLHALDQAFGRGYKAVHEGDEGIVYVPHRKELEDSLPQYYSGHATGEAGFERKRGVSSIDEILQMKAEAKDPDLIKILSNPDELLSLRGQASAKSNANKAFVNAVGDVFGTSKVVHDPEKIAEETALLRRQKDKLQEVQKQIEAIDKQHAGKIHGIKSTIGRRKVAAAKDIKRQSDELVAEATGKTRQRLQQTKADLAHAKAREETLAGKAQNAAKPYEEVVAGIKEDIQKLIDIKPPNATAAERMAPDELVRMVGDNFIRAENIRGEIIYTMGLIEDNLKVAAKISGEKRAATALRSLQNTVRDLGNELETIRSQNSELLSHIYKNTPKFRRWKKSDYVLSHVAGDGTGLYKSPKRGQNGHYDWIVFDPRGGTRPLGFHPVKEFEDKFGAAIPDLKPYESGFVPTSLKASPGTEVQDLASATKAREKASQAYQKASKAHTASLAEGNRIRAAAKRLLKEEVGKLDSELADQIANTTAARQMQLYDYQKGAAQIASDIVNTIAKTEHSKIPNPELADWGKTVDLDGAPGVVVPHAINDMVTQVNKVFSNPAEMDKLTKFMSKLSSKWKIGVTVVNPGYRVRNTATDIWNAYAVGRVPIASLNKYSTYNVAKFAKQVHDKDPDAIIKLRYAQFLGVRSGLFKGDISKAAKYLQGGETAASLIKKGRPLKSYVAGMTEFNRRAENWIRMAHYLYKFDHAPKGYTSTLERAAYAAREVRRAHFDYEDLTPFEKNRIKPWIPFYTWTRKNVPAQLIAIAANPGKAAVFGKAVQEAERSAGGSENDIVPGFLSNMGAFKTPAFGGSYFIAPVGQTDLARVTNLDEMGTMLNPGAQIAAAALTGKSIFTQQEIDTGKRVPINDKLASFLSLIPGSDVGKTHRQFGGPNKEVWAQGVNPWFAYALQQVPALNFLAKKNNINEARKGGSELLNLQYLGGLSFNKVNQADQRDIAKLKYEMMLSELYQRAQEEGKMPTPERKPPKHSAYNEWLVKNAEIYFSNHGT